MSRSDLLEIIPKQVGPRLSTLRGGVVHSVRGPGNMTFSSPGDFVAVVLSPVPGMLSRLGSDVFHPFDAPTGAVVVNPGHVDSASSWPSLRQNVTVGFQPGYLAELAAREFDLPDLELHPPPFGHVDAQALQIALLIKQELASGNGNELYVESLMTVLGLHVVRHYSNGNAKRTSQAAGGGLTSGNAQKVQDFLKEHFADKITVAGLADLCGLSPGHFIHAFTRTFGESPHRYLVKLRLTFATKLLSETNLPIAEVAYLSGFSSQSHLTSAMSKNNQTTPARVRATGI